jgi:hypothetical protein
MSSRTERTQKMFVSDKESSLIRKLRHIPHSRVTIIMVDGHPDRVETGIQSEKL